MDAGATGKPRVSIGLPVHDGERFLAEALDSLLAQTFADFELILGDNASTDGTEEICRRYSESDGRIRYVRSAENVGAAANFNAVLALAQGEYFKWAAHDDVCRPEFLARCVEVLDGDASVVLAYPRTRIIDADSAVVEDHDLKLASDAELASDRFGALMQGHKCFEIFGLIRKPALDRTPGIGAFAHGDGVLLTRLAVQGRLVEIPEPLFLARRHAEQSMRMIADRWAYSAWFDPEKAGRLLFPHWRVAREFGRTVGDSGLDLRARLRCYGHVLRWMRFHRGRLRGDLTRAARHAMGFRR